MALLQSLVTSPFIIGFYQGFSSNFTFLEVVVSPSCFHEIDSFSCTFTNDSPVFWGRGRPFSEKYIQSSQAPGGFLRLFEVCRSWKSIQFIPIHSNSFQLLIFLAARHIRSLP